MGLKGLFSRKQHTVVKVHRFDGPGAKAGEKCAYFNIYEHEDGTCHTIEFDRSGAHVAEYDGEPVFSDGEEPKPLGETEPPSSKKGK